MAEGGARESKSGQSPPKVPRTQDMSRIQDNSVMQGWHAVEMTPAGNVSALCRASTPGPFMMLLGKICAPIPTQPPTQVLGRSDPLLLFSPLGVHGIGSSTHTSEQARLSTILA